MNKIYFLCMMLFIILSVSASAVIEINISITELPLDGIFYKKLQAPSDSLITFDYSGSRFTTGVPNVTINDDGYYNLSFNYNFSKETLNDLYQDIIVMHRDDIETIMNIYYLVNDTKTFVNTSANENITFLKCDSENGMITTCNKVNMTEIINNVTASIDAECTFEANLTGAIIEYFNISEKLESCLAVSEQSSMLYSQIVNSTEDMLKECKLKNTQYDEKLISCSTDTIAEVKKDSYIIPKMIAYFFTAVMIGAIGFLFFSSYHKTGF